MFDNKTQSSSDEGVSPVIGVILMVAITVVLAAVIGTFVLNLTDNLEQSAQAAVSFDETSGQSVDVQLNNVQSADHIYVKASTGADADWTGGVTFTDADGDGTKAGSTYDSSIPASRWLQTTDSETSSEVGGVGTTSTLWTESSNGTQLNAGTISVIGVLKGKENVVQTYDYAAGSS